MKMGEKTLHCKIIEEIMRFVGTSSHINKKIGMQAYSDAISLMVSKKAFEREFTQLFALWYIQIIALITLFEYYRCL